jgi:SsrA-binding protein
MKFVNRKAKFNFEIIEEYKSGIVLFGSEVKSIRLNNINFGDSFITIINGVPILKSLHISKYENSSYLNHDEMRDRTLLLNKREIKKLEDLVSQKGLTLIPLEIFTDRNLFKVKIGLCRGKKLWNKKQSIKERDLDIDLKRNLV